MAVPKEAELADLANDVNSLGRSLAETEARRVRLLGEVAHELRTPLTVIDGYVEGMLDQVLPTDAGSLGQVLDESRRLRRLADDLSALSRAEEGRLELKRGTADVRPVVAAAVGIDFGGPTKFAHPDHQRFVQQAPFLEIVQQGGVGLLHRRHERVFQTRKVVVMSIPGDTGTIHGGDKASPRFDQPACQQMRLSPAMPPITIPHLVRFQG